MKAETDTLIQMSTFFKGEVDFSPFFTFLLFYISYTNNFNQDENLTFMQRRKSIYTLKCIHIRI